MTKKALIIGYGNPLRGDDGVGQAAAQALETEAVATGVEVIGCQQLTIEMAETLAGMDVAVFIDAAAGHEPGSIAVTKVEEAPGMPVGLAHHVEPELLLLIARKLFGHAPEAFLVTVGAGSLELSEDLTDAVAAALPKVVATVRQLTLEHIC